MLRPHGRGPHGFDRIARSTAGHAKGAFRTQRLDAQRRSAGSAVGMQEAGAAGIDLMHARANARRPPAAPPDAPVSLRIAASLRQRRSAMPFVVTENCIKCKYTDCVEVCPVDCFHEGPNFLVIDPDECIDCTLCEPECPINAIYPEDDVPAGQEQFVALNAELSKAWPVITVRKDGMPDARDWEGKPDKLPLLER